MLLTCAPIHADLFELLQRSKRQRDAAAQRQPLGLARPSEEEEAEEAAAAQEGPAVAAGLEGAATRAALGGEPAVAAAAATAPAAPVVHATVQAAAQMAAAGMQTEQREQRRVGVQAGRPQLRLFASTAAQTAAPPSTAEAEVQVRSRRSGAAQTEPQHVQVASALVQTSGVDAGVQHRGHVGRTAAGTQTSARLGLVDRQLQVRGRCLSWLRLHSNGTSCRGGQLLLVAVFGCQPTWPQLACISTPTNLYAPCACRPQVHMVPKVKRTAAAAPRGGSPQVNARLPAAPAVAAVAAPAQAPVAQPAAAGESPTATEAAAAAATASAAGGSSRSTAGGRRQRPVQLVQHQHRAAVRHETEAGLVVTEVDKAAHPTRLAPDRTGVAAAQQRQADAARRRQERERQQEAEQRQQAEQAASAQQAAAAQGAAMASHKGPAQPPALPPTQRQPQPQVQAGPAAQQPAEAAPQRKRARSVGLEAVQQEQQPQRQLSPVLLAAQKKIREAQLERAAKRLREAPNGAAAAAATAVQAGAPAPQLHRLAGPVPAQQVQQAAPAQQQAYVLPAPQAQQALYVPATQAQHEAPASGPRYAAAPLMRLPKPAQAAAALQQDGEGAERESSPEEEHSPWGW